MLNVILGAHALASISMVPLPGRRFHRRVDPRAILMGRESAEIYRRRVYRDYVAAVSAPLRPETTRESLTSLDARYRADFLPWLPADKNARILEVGCGWGSFLSWLGREGYRDAVGIDRSPEVVRRARALGAGEIVETDALAYLAAHKGEFDCVVTIDVLEHLFKDEIVELLDAIHAALKPGGTILIQTMNADGLTAPRMLYIDYTHETAFTRYSLEQVLSITGFASPEFRPLGPFGDSFRQRLARLGWLFFRLLMGLYYHMEAGSGIWRNDHILSIEILARGRKAPEGAR